MASGWTYTAVNLEGWNCGHEHYSVEAAARCASRQRARMDSGGPVYILAREAADREEGLPVILGEAAAPECTRVVEPLPWRNLGRELGNGWAGRNARENDHKGQSAVFDTDGDCMGHINPANGRFVRAKN